MSNKPKTVTNTAYNPKTDMLLCIFLGWTGAHRLYEGKLVTGFLYLFTLGIFGIGWIVDICINVGRLASGVPVMVQQAGIPAPYQSVPVPNTMTSNRQSVPYQYNGMSVTTTVSSQSLESLQSEFQKLETQIASQKKKLSRMKELYKAVEYSVTENALLPPEQAAEYDDLCPSVTLNLHCMEMKDLQKEYRANDKRIQDLTEKYSSRYTTKTNAAIYKLMTLALRAELQNILVALKYEKLDTAVSAVKDMTQKFYTVAAEGNQTIAPTLKEYIEKLEYLFIDAVKIEYNYYVKREQAKAEQAALREQMRQEAAERKALEEERKKIEAEEAKYQAEISKLTESMASASEADKAAIEARISELQGQLNGVAERKDEITKLQNGKAGTVYVISNLGAFGEDVFKVGMTRRLDPQDRVDELGSASVPFRFDVHSFIFSEDAVSLETKLHQALNEKRLNKVNRHKEFFKVSLEELEKLVHDTDPTAAFNTTMAAEEYRQSLSSDSVYTDDYVEGDDEEEDSVA